MKTVKRFFYSSVLLVLAGFAHSQGVSYNYGEVRYLDSEIGNLDGDGIEIAGSYQIDPEWVVLGSYSNQDFGGADWDVLELGAGYILPQANGFDLLVSASFVSSDFGDNDDNGIRLTAGARNELTEELEGRISLNYLNIDDSDLFLELGADYFFSPQLSAGAEVQLGSDTDTFSIGARWYYDR